MHNTLRVHISQTTDVTSLCVSLLPECFAANAARLTRTAALRFSARDAERGLRMLLSNRAKGLAAPQ
jgi:hypothetical protein